MIPIHLDGELRTVSEGSTLLSLIPEHPKGCAVAIIRPATKEQEKTESITVTTTSGEITIELAGIAVDVLDHPDAAISLTLHWTDRYAAAFGPFPSGIRPLRKPRLYERGTSFSGAAGTTPRSRTSSFPKAGCRGPWC